MAGRKRKSTQSKQVTKNESDQEFNGDASKLENSDADAQSESENLSEDIDAGEKKSEKVKKGRGRGRPPQKKPALEKEEDSKYEVEAVVGDKIVSGNLHYLIHWKGYSDDEDTWEPENTLSCPELVKKYLASKEKKNNKKGGLKKGSPRKSETDDDPSYTGNGVPSGKKKSKAKRAASNDSAGSSDEDENDGKDYEVKSIIEVHYCRNGTKEFLVRWKGFGSKDDTWEPEKNLNCPDLIEKFLSKVDEKRSATSKELRVNRAHTDRFSLTTQGSARRLSKRFDGKQRVQYHEADE